MKKQLHFKFSTTQTVMISFFLAILGGSILLALPLSSATGNAVPYIDALFTATTSVCVTGLVTLPTVSTWSIFGQIVILFLIQIGGLGIITIMFGVFIGLHKRIGIQDRILIQDALVGSVNAPKAVPPLVVFKYVEESPSSDAFRKVI